MAHFRWLMLVLGKLQNLWKLPSLQWLFKIKGIVLKEAWLPESLGSAFPSTIYKCLYCMLEYRKAAHCVSPLVPGDILKKARDIYPQFLERGVCIYIGDTVLVKRHRNGRGHGGGRRAKD